MKKSIIALCILSAVLCSSCGGNTSVSSSENTTTSSAATTVASYEATTAESSEETTVTTTEVKTTTTVFSETTEQSETSTQPVTTLAESSAVSETTVASTEETTVQATETSTEIITETEPPAAEKPPAVIFARAVSSPGDKTEKTDSAVIDYSNASLGYISAAYNGKSARAKLRIVCGDITTDHDLSVSGEYEYFPLMQGSGDYRIQIYEQLDGKMYSAALDLSVALAVDNEVEMYLYPNQYSMFDKKSDCVVLSADLCAGKDNVIEKTAAIFKYITDNIAYDYDLAATVKSGYIPKPDSVLKNKKGICFDYASLFAAMARSQNIPCRLVIGYADPDIYHAWNEVYTEETGWITPELLLSRSGYNLVDATFYAGAKDKKTIAEYISDGGNYSSVYKY